MILVNGLPADEWACRQAKWSERMAVRLPVEQFDLRKLVNHLLSQHWQHECKIELKRLGALEQWVVSFTHPDHAEDGPSYLRYSKGPGTGTFWDCYGDDFRSPELALIELAKAYPPPRVGTVIPTHGR